MSTQIAIKQSQLQNWAIVIKECKESGLKVADFCNQHGISKHAYYYWFKKVRAELFSSQNSFVEISGKTDPESSDRSSTFTNENIEVHVNGISLSVPMSVTKDVYAGHLIHTARSNCTSISVVLYHPNG